MEEILRFTNICYAYAEGADALTDCSVALYAGQKVAVLGNNGAGKSTFFLLANGVLKPRSGEIRFAGRKIGRTNRDLNTLRRHVGLVFQDPDVMMVAGSVEEEISFGPMNLRLPEPEVRRRVDEAVRAFALEDFCTRAPQYLSGGEKKRVTLADALAMEPRLLLLDEPAASLDPRNASLLEENLRMLAQRGLGLVVATHDVDFAWRWADRILLFHAGRLVADRTPEEAFGDSALLGACNLQQPTLYQVGRALGLAKMPRTVQEVKESLYNEKSAVGC